MTDFYIKTETTIAGPFTGVEVREATLARVVLPETGIGASQQGPWTRAADAGLFSDKKVPLPHPPDTQVPRFRLTGVSEAFEGPFKLRELIGFAARRMLPSDALVQADGRSDWTPVTRIGILDACINGDLVPAGAHHQADSHDEVAHADSPHDTSARWRGAKKSVPSRSRASALQPKAAANHSGPEGMQGSPTSQQTGDDVAGTDDSVDAEDESDQEPASLAEFNEQWRKGLQERSNFQIPSISWKSVAAFAVIAALPLVWFFWDGEGMSRSELIGDWVYLSSEGEPESTSPFGVSFREDGTCVVFNTRGQSWSGEFVWIDHDLDTKGFATLASMQSKITDVDPAHQRGVVEPGDGYVKLTGSFSKEPPLVGNQRIRECYVRRDGDNLRMGYVATINWSQSTKTMEAGWFEMTPTNSQPERVARLTPNDPINGTNLLAEFGLPDEARPLHQFERPIVSDPELLVGLQLVRYGKREFILSSDGELQDLSKASWEHAGSENTAINPAAEATSDGDDS